MKGDGMTKFDPDIVDLTEKGVLAIEQKLKSDCSNKELGEHIDYQLRLMDLINDRIHRPIFDKLKKVTTFKNSDFEDLKETYELSPQYYVWLMSFFKYDWALLSGLDCYNTL
jgi:hypothetical protein